MTTLAARDNHRRFAIAVSICLFLLACATPALEMRSIPLYPRPGREGPQVEATFGIYYLLLGWALYGLPLLAWFANATLALGWIALLIRRFRVALLLAISSLLLAADLARWAPGGEELGIHMGRANEFIERALPGCYFWVASMVTLGLGAMYCWWHQHPRGELRVFALILAVLLASALGWYYSLRPFDQWRAQANEYLLNQRVAAEQPIGGTEAEALAFLRGLGIADAHIRLFKSSAGLDYIHGWFPKPDHPFVPAYPQRVMVTCKFGIQSQRLENCRTYEDSGGDPTIAPGYYLKVATPIPLR